MSNSSVVDEAIRFLAPFLEKKLYCQEKKPLVIGIEGPQGSGKTTAATNIRVKLLEKINCNIVQFSMDDFYLTFEQQLNLNRENQDNKLLQGRGLPGTHDVELLMKIFKDLIDIGHDKSPVKIPVYDKSLHNGKGDRLPLEKWNVVEKRVDLIIFEGWFNGYTSINTEETLIRKWNSIKATHPRKFGDVEDRHIQKINCDLRRYEQIWGLFDLFVCIKTENINNVYRWRLQQEHALIKKKGSGMTDMEVETFVDRYMPVYYLYYDGLGKTEEKINSLELDIDEFRNLVNSNYIMQ